MRIAMCCLCLVTLANCTAEELPTKPPVSHAYKIDRTAKGALAQREAEIVEAVVTVEKIEGEARRLLVRGAGGEQFPIVAGPEIKRFSEIRVGDKIIARFLRTLAFEVRQPTQAELENPLVIASAAKKADKSLPPGSEAANLLHMIVTVGEIDLKANTVKLTLPDGKALTVQARFPENLTRVKAGDKVAVTYAEAVAVGIEPHL